MKEVLFKMLVAKYKNELYKTIIKSNTLEIITHDKKDGFQYRKSRKGVISYKCVEREELEELYTVKYYTVWNGERFEFDYTRGDATLRLWRFDLTNNLIEKYGFTEMGRGEKVKEVSLDSCECFIMQKKEYDNQANESEITLSQVEFLESYEKFV